MLGFEANFGRLGNGNSTANKNRPVVVKGIENNGNMSEALDISSSSYHSCVLKKGGLVACWGRGDSYQLGNASDSNKNTPVAVILRDENAGFFSTSTIVPSQQISTYYRHACAVKSDGTTLCWGEGDDNRLGQANTTDQRVPAVVASLEDVRAIRAGNKHTCALRSNNKVVCWGSQANGSLGNGTSNANTSVATPTLVNNHSGNTGDLSGVRQLSVGGDHSCAVLNNNKVVCWGKNDSGRLGDNSTTHRSSPVFVENDDDDAITGIKQVSAGSSHTCAARNNGEAYCWGSNSAKQVSSGSSGNYKYARSVKSNSSTNLNNIVKVEAGYSHSCALRTDGKVRCWGSNTVSQIGYGSSGGNKTYADKNVLAPGEASDGTALSGVIDLVVGTSSSCALLKSQKIVCWGDSTDNILGNGSTTDTTETQWVLGEDNSGQLGDVVGINVGWYVACALKADGRILCWGKGSYYTLGDDSNSGNTYPQPVLKSTGSTKPFSVFD